MLSSFILFFEFSLFSLYLSACQPSPAEPKKSISPKHETPSHINPAQVIAEKNLDKDKLEILIDKSDYALWLMVGEDTVKKYAVVFGGNPKDEKLRQGDKCTPEGTFRVRDLYPHKSWSKFIWIDYPNDVSRKKHAAAKKDGKIPVTAKIGGDVGLHGVPPGTDYMIDRRSNWTLGCISLKNTDINEIYPLIKKGTKVTIRK